MSAPRSIKFNQDDIMLFNFAVEIGISENQNVTGRGERAESNEKSEKEERIHDRSISSEMRKVCSS